MWKVLLGHHRVEGSPWPSPCVLQPLFAVVVDDVVGVYPILWSVKRTTETLTTPWKTSCRPS